MNSMPREPWIIYNRKSCILGGNAEGFRLLRDSIDRVIAGEGNPIDIEGNDIEVCGIQLAENPGEIPSPPFSNRNLILFICLLTCFLVLAAIGFVTTVNWLTSF